MRLIKIHFLNEVITDYPKSKKWIGNWGSNVKKAEWQNLQHVRFSYPSADLVTLANGRKVVVFNMCGNDFRLIVAIHYNKQIVYTLRFLTHSDYNKDKWKNEL